MNVNSDEWLTSFQVRRRFTLLHFRYVNFRQETISIYIVRFHFSHRRQRPRLSELASSSPACR